MHATCRHALHARVIWHPSASKACHEESSIYLSALPDVYEDDDDESQSLLSPSVLQLLISSDVSSKSFETRILKLMISSGKSKLANHKNRNCFRCSHQCFCCFCFFLSLLYGSTYLGEFGFISICVRKALTQTMTRVCKTILTLICLPDISLWPVL